MILVIVILLMLLLVLSKEGFSPSSRPVDHENNMSNFGPFYNIDYITPFINLTHNVKKNSRIAPYVSNG